MRLFLAIELPAEVREHLVQVQEVLRELAPRAQFTRPENLHVTLRFLGNVRDDELPKIDESLKKVSAPSPPSISAQRIECFPDRGPARILAAGMDGDLPAIKAVHQAIEQRCRFLGFQRETRQYQPHATLVRARPVFPRQVGEKAIESAGPLLPGPTFELRQFVLFQSHLTAAGAQYIVVGRYPLSPG